MITGDAIQSSEMSNFFYTKYGSLQGFSIGDTVYRYCTNKVNPGYYDFNKYLDFIAGNSTTVPPDLRPYDKFIGAQTDDTIKIYQRNISTDFTKVCWFTYYFKHVQGMNYGDYTKITPSPGYYQPDDSPNCSHDTTALDFYNNYINKAISANDSELAEILADIQQLIESVELNILTKLDTQYQAYVVNQRALWSDGTTFNYADPDIIALKQKYLAYKQILSTFSQYYQSYQKKLGNDVQLIFIYLASFMDPLILKPLSAHTKVLMLIKLANRSLENWQIFYNPLDSQSVVITIVQSVSEIDADEFLGEMIRINAQITGGYTNLFVSFYYGLQNSFFGLGQGRIKDFITAMYYIWRVSKYNPYQNDTFNQTNFNKYTYNNQIGTAPNSDDFWSTALGLGPKTLNYSAAPIILNYISKKFIGIYFDNFKFYFDEGQDLVDFENDMKDFDNYQYSTNGKIKAVQDDYRDSGDKGLYGTYDYLQPVALADSNQETIIKMPVIDGNVTIDGNKLNSLIPIFVLKYIDDAGDESDLNTSIGYFVDIVLLYVGFAGLIEKLKYIRSLWGLTDAIIAGSEFGTGTVITLYGSTAFAALNLSSATVSLLFKLSGDAFVNEPWYKSLSKTLTWIEMLSAGGSVLSDRLLKVSVKNLVEDFNTNGYPDDFVSDARGSDARASLGQISGMADEINAALTQQFKASIIEQVDEIVNDNATFQFNKVVDGVVTDEPLHTDADIDEIIQNGFSAGLTKDENAGLLAISYRVGNSLNLSKQIETADLIEQMTNYGTIIKPRGYSYGFDNLADFETFETQITQLVEDFGLSASDIRIQGSSLRNPSFKDIDVGIFLSQDDAAELAEKIRNNIKARFTNSAGEVEPLKQKKYEDALKAFENQYSKGLIKQIYFGKLPNGNTLLTERVDRGILSGTPLNVSVIVNDGKFSIPPFINIK